MAVIMRSACVRVVGCAALLCVGVEASGQEVPAGERRSSLVQRSRAVGIEAPAPAPLPNTSPGAPALFPLVVRTIDGTGNNVANPTWGAAGTPMLRMLPASYPDGVGDVPARDGGPSARAVSNEMCAQDAGRPNLLGASDYLWQWGQFLDHDIVETPVAAPAEPYDIAVPRWDPWFDPAGSGGVTIGLDRSAYVVADGARQQINEITAFVDASNVYGSHGARASALRANDGTGRLATSDGDLLPYNTAGLANAPTAHDPSFFLAGDIRANEQTGLAAMHTLFVREHNRWAELIAASDPGLTGDEIYERARAIVGAEMQAITYNEFLPLLLGEGAIGAYTGYRPDVHPGIMNEFAAAGYRVGHTMLSATLRRISADGTEAPEGHIGLRDAFFEPTEISEHGIDTVLRGLAFQLSQDTDARVIDDVRNLLFGQPGAGGFDLASLNVQRGRDHGLAGYNAIRVACGLAPVQDFDDIPAEAGMRSKLASMYATPDDIDPWVGLLAERHLPGALVGETLHRLLVDQFVRLRDGDRFWYEGYLPVDMVRMVNEQTLSRIIRRNTGIGDELPDDVFRVDSFCRADLNGDGSLDFFDVAMFLTDFRGEAARADFAEPYGVWNFFDVQAFLAELRSGCE